MCLSGVPPAAGGDSACASGASGGSLYHQSGLSGRHGGYCRSGPGVPSPGNGSAGRQCPWGIPPLSQTRDAPPGSGADLCCDSAHKTLPVLTGRRVSACGKAGTAGFCGKREGGPGAFRLHQSFLSHADLAGSVQPVSGRRLWRPAGDTAARMEALRGTCGQPDGRRSAPIPCG